MKTSAYIASRTAQIVALACKYGALSGESLAEYWCHRGALGELISLAMHDDDQVTLSRLFRVLEAMSIARFYFDEIRLNGLRASA